MHSFIPALGALAAVLALVLLSGRVVQRLGLARAQGGARRLTIQDSLSLDRTRRMHVIRCDDRELLLISGGGGADTVVGWLPIPEIRT